MGDEPDKADKKCSHKINIKDRVRIFSETIPPSELREVFSRTKCCLKNCMENKLRMPRIGVNRLSSNGNKPPTLSSASSNYVSSVKSNNHEPFDFIRKGKTCINNNCKDTTCSSKDTTTSSGPVSVEEFETMVLEARTIMEGLTVSYTIFSQYFYLF